VGKKRVEDVELLLNQLRDVIAAKVVLDEHAGIAAIRVLAKAGRNARHLVRDVQSALMGKFGLEVAAENITVAQLADELEEELIPPRVQFHGVSWGLYGGSAEVQVQLAAPGASIIGSASGPATVNGRTRLAAEATLDAIHSYLGQEVFELVDVRIVPMSEQRVAVVAVSLVGNEGNGSYVGCGLVRLDESEAVARATLSALNRYLTWL